MKLSKYVKIYPHRENPDQLLLFSTRRLSKILVPRSILKQIEDGTVSDKNRETLARLGFLTADPEGERREMLDALQHFEKDNKNCRIVVVLNLDCNLACSYCFEGNRRGEHYLSHETAGTLVEFITDTYIEKGMGVNVDFYGGEPLLSLDLIREISRSLSGRTERKGTTYSCSLVTNGTLFTRKVAEELVAIGLRNVKITVDGPPEIHDRSRPFASGRGSFDLILKNMKDTCDLVRIQTGGNYTQDNYRSFPALLDLFIREGLTPEKLGGIIFAPVTSTLGEFAMPEFSDGCTSADEPWLIKASVFLREEILRRGYRTPKVGPAICLVEWKNFMVVNHDGMIYKCPAFIGCDGLEIGDLKTGVRDYSESYRMDIWKNDECLDCAYLPLCFGGCRFLKMMQSGAIDGVECRRDYLNASLESFLLQDLTYLNKAG